MCRNSESGKCKFGDNCWYKHTNEMENKNTTESLENSSELIQKLFDMMEKFASKLEALENKQGNNRKCKISLFDQYY